MGQILAVDYGKARCGLAATDDMQIIASGLETVNTPRVMDYLKDYFQFNKVDEIVVGLPIDLRGNISEVETDILKFIEDFSLKYPQIPVHHNDVRVFEGILEKILQ